MNHSRVTPSGDGARLKAWMDEKGYSNRALATELDYSYDYIYALLVGRRPFADGFRFRFINRFGVYEARKVFHVERRTQPQTHGLQAVPE